MRNAITIPGSMVFIAAVAGALGGQQQTAWRTTSTRVGDTTVVRTALGNAALAELQAVRSGQIGMESGPPEQQLTVVTTTLAMRNGGVIFFDGYTHRLLWFDSAMKYVRTISRVGNGPGELPPVTWTVSPGSVVEDRTVSKIARDQSGRIVLRVNGYMGSRGDGILTFSPSGEFLSAWDLPRRPNPGSLASALSPTGVLSFGYRIETREGCVGPNGEPICREIVARYRMDGTIVDSMFAPALPWTLPSAFYSIRPGPRGDGPLQKRFARIPFVPYPITHLSAHGYWITALPDRYEITLHNGAAPTRIISDSPPVQLDPAERRATLDQFAPRFSRDVPASRVTINEIPAVKPRFKEVRTDEDGRVWVTIHAPAERRLAQASGGTTVERWVEPILYDIFAPTGEFLGRLRQPSFGRFMGAAGSYMWMSESDSLDVARMVRYTISARSPQSPSAAYWRGR